MSQSQIIADYYNQTQNHYQKWWGLNDSLSLHYGIWEKDTRSFKQALHNTNLHLAKIGRLLEGQTVLDAGCGVGGAAFYLAQQYKAKVTALSLSSKQLALAEKKSNELGLSGQVQFELMDFTQTDKADNSFERVWACESVCHTIDKADFLAEAYRLLKAKGRLVLADFFRNEASDKSPQPYLDKWAHSWGVPNFSQTRHFIQQMKENGFHSIEVHDFTNHIRKSAARMYYASLLGALPSELYNLFHPQVSTFAKKHYTCGYYQYKALKADLWKYLIITAEK